jgi:hypothetical protein
MELEGDETTKEQGPGSGPPAQGWRMECLVIWSAVPFVLAFLLSDCRERRDHLADVLAAAVGAGDVPFFAVRHMQASGELFSAILAMKYVFRHGLLPPA